MKKIECPFKVGEWVEQVEWLLPGQSELCKIIKIDKLNSKLGIYMLLHWHRGDYHTYNSNNLDKKEKRIKMEKSSSFRVLPRLRRLLLYGEEEE